MLKLEVHNMLATLLSIALLHWVVLVTPGANVLLISQLAASGHRRAACFAALGISMVALLWSTLAVLGVSAVFAAHPSLRIALQAAGGFYLCYVAFRLWRSGTGKATGASKALGAIAAFRMGFLTNIMNPKSALFFGSVFATSLPPEPSTALLLPAIALVVVNALCWHFFLALAFSQARVQAVYAAQRKGLARVAAVLVCAFGLRLLFASVREVRSP